MKRLVFAMGLAVIAASPALAADPIGYTAADGINAVRVTAAAPLPVATPAPATVVAGQKAVSATAAALGSAALANGVVIKARATNAGPVWIGAAGVTTTDDGTGAGYKLLPGEAASFAVSNTNAIYIVGTAGDVVYYEGN
jgi:hypothetical protein